MNLKSILKQLPENADVDEVMRHSGFGPWLRSKVELIRAIMRNPADGRVGRPKVYTDEVIIPIMQQYPDPFSVRELAAEMDGTPSSVHVALVRLCDAGLAVREDRGYALTEGGRAWRAASARGEEV